MRVDQVITGAAPGDAVTESALRVRDALRGAVTADVFAWHIHPDLADTVSPIADFQNRPQGHAHDLLVYHITIGQEEVTDFIVGRPERLLAVYHNITPSSFFERVDPQFADLLDHGRELLPRVLVRAERIVADSEFNAAELRSLGFPGVTVLAPPVNVQRLVETEPDPEMQQHLDEWATGPMVLFVGQPLPHKRPDLLIGAHHLLSTNWVPDARLAIVGPSHGRPYEEALRHLVADLQLDSVWFTGRLTDAALAALYRRADLFVTASEHEGFCVPIVEAFAFGVPAIARAFGAIPDTAGEAALVLPAFSGTRALAEAQVQVLTDVRLRATLVERGRARAARYALARTLPPMVAVIRDAIRAGRPGARP